MEKKLFEKSSLKDRPMTKPLGVRWNQFLKETTNLLGESFVDVDNIDAITNNYQSVERSALGSISPATKKDLEEIVRLANLYQIPLYPISGGKNMGYGSSAPCTEGQVIVNLSRLNKIINYDADTGEVTVEPGVTQEQLSIFLRQNGNQYIADVTGASPQASIIGNTLESGFGHTPLGNHRKEIISCEVLLGNGTTLDSGEFPNLGPDPSGLFIQSNFGIMTKLRIPLYPVPETIASFVIKFKGSVEFESALQPLSQLRRDGVINSLLHIANSTRMLITNATFPEDFPKEKILSENDCLDILNGSPIKVSMWTAIGGLYGTREEVRLKYKYLKKALMGLAQVDLFTDKKFKAIKKIAELPIIRNLRIGQQITSSVESLSAIHGLLKGIPTNRPNENILWRQKSLKDMGLIWYAPILNINEVDLVDLKTLAGKVFQKYSFEFPITLTLIDHKKMIAVMNISFDRSNKEEVKRAHAAQRELSYVLESNGYHPYRLGILKAQTHQFPKDKQAVFSDLKRVFDPNGIIAPGRYGIGNLSKESRQ